MASQKSESFSVSKFRSSEDWIFWTPIAIFFMYSWALHYKTPLRNSRPTFQVYAVRRYAALLVTRRDATELRFVMRFVNRMHMASSL